MQSVDSDQICHILQHLIWSAVFANYPFGDFSTKIGLECFVLEKASFSNISVDIFLISQ